MELTLRWLLEQLAVGADCSVRPHWTIFGQHRRGPRGPRRGYAYIGLDAQHGLIDYRGCLATMQAIDAASTAAGSTAALVRVAANNAALIGRALDAGAAGVIVPQ
jgi:4-hydroxy-2-oxoheptanedioate aldolase